MAYRDYEASKKVELALMEINPTDRGMIMGCMRRADNDTLEKLKSLFPDVWEELLARYHAPGGFLTDEEMELAGVCFDTMDDHENTVGDDET